MDPQPGDDVLLACSAEGAVTEIEPSPSHLPTAAVAAEETEKAILSLSEAAAKIVPTDLAAFFAKVNAVPDAALWSFYCYLEKAFPQVSSQWLNVFKEFPWSHDVSSSLIPKSVYETSGAWINQLQTNKHCTFVMWALDRLLLVDWAAHAQDTTTTCSSQVAAFVALAIMLRSKPAALTYLLPMLRDRPRYQGEDKLPVIVWTMAQAFFNGDLCAGLYSWAHNLLPLVDYKNKSYSPQSVDLILRFVEIILSEPDARTILFNGAAVRERKQLMIPPSSFEILVRLTFPASSVEETERFGTIYPLLKEVAFAPGGNTVKHIFTFSLKLAGDVSPKTENPGLAKEATAIAIRIKNEHAIAEGVANCFLYKEADKSCKLISRRLSRGNDGLKIAPLTAITIAAAGAEGAVTEIEPSPSHLPTAAVAAEEAEKGILSLSEAAAKIVPSDLAAFLADTLDKHWPIPSKQILILVDYYGDKLSQVSFRWVKMFQETSLSTLIHVPFPQIPPTSVYETSVDFINILPFETTLRAFVLWASDLILTEWPGVVKIEQNNSNKSKVATFVALAMLLRCKPDALTTVLPHLRETPTYQGEDKLPFIIWMMAQASQGDLSAGLYSWSRNLLPLVGNNKCYSPQAMDLILQFVEMILTNPEAPTILVNEAVKEGERLIPPSSFAILVQHTFPASSARVETTKRFEAIYPLLKEVALAPEKATGSDTMKQIFTFSLRLAGEGNPVLAKEAIAIAIRCVKKNVGCFKHWDNLYTENIKASVALLKKLVDDWKDHSIKLLSSPSDTLVVKRTIYSFRVKNDEAIAEGVANCFLYKEADKSCKLISRRLSRGNDGLKIAPLTAITIAAAGAAVGAALALSSHTHKLKNWLSPKPSSLI